MDYVFSAIGGSGSNYLIKTLSDKYEVGNKPDTVFRPKITKLRIGNLNINQGTFIERSKGFYVDENASLIEILPKYIQYLKESPNRTAVFNTCAEIGLFSYFGIQNVIFLIRHPFHSYISWSKPERHGDVVNYLGGINSHKAVEFWATRWNNFSNEILKLKSQNILGGLIRFEYALADSKNISGISGVFSNFDSSLRNDGILNPYFKSVLKRHVWKNYSLFYRNWNI